MGYYVFVIKSKEEYKELLEESLRTVESTLQHLEWETAQMPMKQAFQEQIRFDVVPILKKLKETKKLIHQSLEYLY